MKNKILKLIMMSSKFSFYGFIVQLVLTNCLLAYNGNAQESEIVSVKEKLISLVLRDASIEDIFIAIEKSSDYDFFYDRDFIDRKIKMDLNITEEPISDLLLQISKKAHLKFRQVNNIINVSKIKSRKIEKEKVLEVIIQARRVTGKVTSAEDDDGIPGVNVVEKGTSNGTVTDVNGNYSLEVSESATLVFSSVGFTSQEMALGNRSVIDVQLEPAIKELSEVVVIGYGAREKKDVTTSISTVSSDELTKSTSMSPELAMQGRTTGVFVESGGGNPFARPTIRIRGTNTWGVAEPLYVIDGVPVTEFGSGGEGEYGQGSTSAGRVNSLRGNVNIQTLVNPNDIESISILKDASAAAIYGVRAANGVVLITTKKGKVGKPTVEFNMKYGIQNIPNTYNVLNVEQYVNLHNEMYANNPDALPNLPNVFKDSVPEEYLGNRPTFDWQEPLLNKNAPIQDYSLKISGGSENINYYLSTGYSNTESTYIGDEQERYSLTANINSEITKMIRTGLNMRVVFSDIDANSRGDLHGMAFSPPPWQPIYDPDGPAYLNGYAPTNELWYDEDGEFQSRRLWGPETMSNNYGRMSTEWNKRYLLRNMGTAYVEFEPLQGLVFKGTLSGDWYEQKNRGFTEIYQQYFNETPRDLYEDGVPGEDDTQGRAGQRYTSNWNLVKEFSINYNNSFGSHNIDILLNVMDQQYTYEVTNAGTEIVLNTFPEIPYVPLPEIDQQYTTGWGEKYRYGLQGYLGRLSYNFENKYYLDGTVRRDGTSRFSKEKRWGTFPSFSAAWRISAEDFMQTVPFITDLKFRLGWGQLGNQETLAYAFLSLINRNPTYRYGSGNGDALGIFDYGAALPDYPNPELGWETTTTTNIGFDGVLFNTLEMSFEYYRKITDDILQDSDLPPSVGNESPPIVNVASVRNQGVELSLSYSGAIGEFTYGVSGNLTTVNNEVLEMYDDAPIGGNTDRIEEGYPINYLWGFKVGGLYRNESEITEKQEIYEFKNITRQEPGDLWFQDVYGSPNDEYSFYSPIPDSIVNDFDRTYIGKTIPGHYYGFSFDLAYKGFDLSAFFQGVGDVQKVNGALRSGLSMTGRGNNFMTDVLNRWTPDNRNASIPRAVAEDPAKNNRFSDRWIEDANYLRFGNLQLGYSVPSQSVFGGNAFQNLRIWIGGNNLFTLSNWSGLDPENEDSPIPRTYTMGVDIRF